MTVEELEKATGKELIEERDYCGVDGYYGDYLDNVNAEMLKRFNRFAELEKENAELKEENTELKTKKIPQLERKIALKKELEKSNEWHKQDIDDIYDFIAEDWSVKYFICIMKDKSQVTATGNCDEGCNGEVSVNLFFEHDDEKYYIDDIVWWKEITLPEEG